MSSSARSAQAPEDDRPSRPYAGVATAEREAGRRQRFIDAGIELFGTVGFHATTVRMLTAEAGLTSRYFYESFATTEDLLIACYEQLMRDYRALLDRVIEEAGADFDLRVRAGLTCFFEAMRDARFARIAFSEVLGVSPRVDQLYSRSTAEFAALMMGYLELGGVPVSKHDPHEMRLVGAALAGSVVHAGIAWLRSRFQLPIEQVVSASMRVIMGTAQQLRVA